MLRAINTGGKTITATPSLVSATWQGKPVGVKATAFGHFDAILESRTPLGKKALESSYELMKDFPLNLPDDVQITVYYPEIDVQATNAKQTFISTGKDIPAYQMTVAELHEACLGLQSNAKQAEGKGNIRATMVIFRPLPTCPVYDLGIADTDKPTSKGRGKQAAEGPAVDMSIFADAAEDEDAGKGKGKGK